ncbi:hypothetical protein [Cryobacterium sp.]|jgi:hypothetical protein|nr:hypothetical protein [Cryobacterium sp.]MCU1445321.1 hypothetical protein [Cryobacterium sp.]
MLVHPIVPVIVPDRHGEDITLATAVVADLELAAGETFLTVNR